jgi:hypothetical protein
MFMVPEPPSRVNAAVRQLGALEDVTLKCLEKKPAARYPSMDALIAEIESIARVGTDDRLEILRPHSEDPLRPSAVSLADELEPPAREEMAGLLRASGVPAGMPLGLVLGGVAVAILGAGIGYAWLRPSPSAANVTAEHARLAPAAASAVATAERPALARPEPSAAASEGTAGPEPTTPAPSVPVEPVANTHSRQERANPARPAPNRAESPRNRGNAATPARPPFGKGDIVNPWAK